MQSHVTSSPTAVGPLIPCGPGSLVIIGNGGSVGATVGVGVGTGVGDGFKSSGVGFSLLLKIIDFTVIVIVLPSCISFGLKIWNPRMQPPTQSFVTAKTSVFSSCDSVIFLPQSGCFPLSASYRA